TPYVCRPCERRRATPYATTIERRYSTARYQARKRGVAWCLSVATYKDLLTPNACWCCAGPLSPTGSGLDRIDDTKPYEKANVVPICGSCRDGAGLRAQSRGDEAHRGAAKGPPAGGRVAVVICRPGEIGLPHDTVSDRA